MNKLSLASMMAAAAAISLAASNSASAGILFQSIPDLTAPPEAGWCSGCADQDLFRVYDVFTLSSAATLGSISFDVATDFGPGPSQPINLTISADVGGVPGSTYLDETLTGTFVNAAFETSIVTFAGSGTALAAGSYFISFFADNLGVLGYAGGGGKLITRTHGFSIAHDDSAGFVINSAGGVPEPSAWAMMLVGFGGLGIAMRSRRKLAAAA
jgi:hypothetical protein